MQWWAVALMSILVFAGSSQFICVSMLVSGAAAWSIVLTTLAVNLRHALMSSALAIYLKRISRWFLTFFAYGITDESFALNMARFRSGDWDKWRALVVNQLANAAWIISTVTGTLIGQFIPKGAFGIDYALPGMFICLLVFQLQNRIFILTGILAALISIVWYLFIPGDSYIIGASVSAATLGFFIKQQARRRQ
ncbi:branched-chain amino acid ABC transporter permease [Desulfolithobacter dissulfuricans]|uniref:Branched-chain amino acid ABC transporter permease n=1 Tax=Desulfolithobacter dissulfuricans TaxID=2795293 RepID=A0A915XK07_9BACT|nr:branched-chain amino acid ABC transporter permease [Desulfolithobacter dissulfuricans]